MTQFYENESKTSFETNTIHKTYTLPYTDLHNHSKFKKNLILEVWATNCPPHELFFQVFSVKILIIFERGIYICITLTTFHYFLIFLFLSVFIVNFVNGKISHLFVLKICTVIFPPSQKGLKIASIKPKFNKIQFF